LNIAAQVTKLGAGALAMLFATANFAALPGTLGHPDGAPGATIDSTVLPSIEILPNQSNLAATCGGTAFDVNTFINVDNVASAAVSLSAPTLGTLEQFTDETGTNIGPYNAIYHSFHILGFGGGLAPNTNITVTVTTYTGTGLSGHASYLSTLVFNCTTGSIVSLTNGFTIAAAIPTLSNVALIATALLLAVAATVSLRRKRA